MRQDKTKTLTVLRRKNEGRICVTVKLLNAIHASHIATTLNPKTLHRGADKSLARPGRKQATMTEDFEFHISYL